MEPTQPNTQQSESAAPATSANDTAEKRDPPVKSVAAGVMRVAKWCNNRDGRTWYSYSLEKNVASRQPGVDFDRQRMLLNASDMIVLRKLLDVMVPEVITEVDNELPI